MQAARREAIQHDVIAVREPEGHRPEMQIDGAAVIVLDRAEQRRDRLAVAAAGLWPRSSG